MEQKNFNIPSVVAGLTHAILVQAQRSLTQWQLLQSSLPNCPSVQLSPTLAGILSGTKIK